MRRILATTAMLGLVLSGAAVASASSGEPARQVTGTSGIAWGGCADSPGLEARGAECGFLSVPLDHAKPKGKRISWREIAQ